MRKKREICDTVGDLAAQNVDILFRILMFHQHPRLKLSPKIIYYFNFFRRERWKPIEMFTLLHISSTLRSFRASYASWKHFLETHLQYNISIYCGRITVLFSTLTNTFYPLSIFLNETTYEVVTIVNSYKVNAEISPFVLIMNKGASINRFSCCTRWEYSCGERCEMEMSYILLFSIYII